MVRRQRKQLTQTVAYIFSAIVALSMILSLVGPVLFRESPTPTPTWPPTWTPIPTPTQAPTLAIPTPVILTPAIPTLVIPTADRTSAGTPSNPTPTWTPAQPTLTWTPSPTVTLPISTPVASVTRAVIDPAALLVSVAREGHVGDNVVYTRSLERVTQGGNTFPIYTRDWIAYCCQRIIPMPLITAFGWRQNGTQASIAVTG